MNVPKLRFPEFKGNWLKKRLGLLLEEYCSKSTYQDEYEVLTSSKTGLIRQKEYYKNNRITERNNIGFNILPPNYLTYRSRSDNRKFFFNENNLELTGIISIYYPVFKILNGNNKFFKELLNQHAQIIGKYSVGTSQTVLSMNELKRINLQIPSKTEQKKIASFFKVVDGKLFALQQKRDLLKEYKRGLMQKLFNRELRFTDSNSQPFPDWKEKHLRQVIKTISSGTTAIQNLERIGKPVTRIETISDGIVNYQKVGFVQMSSGLSSYLISKGDLLFSNINSAKHIGKIAYFDGEAELYHGMNLLRIQPDHNKCLPKFLYYFLTSDSMKRYFERICNKAVSQASINQTELGKTKIIYPLLAEQQKIADALSAVDAKIASISNQLEKFEQFKKGLLQQMFV